MLDVYRTEEEQVEALRQWWRESGRSVILGAVLGLLAIFGWRGWQAHLADVSQQASLHYEEMIAMVRSEKPDLVVEKAQMLVQEYPGTAYAVFAQLMLARQSVLDGKLDDAEEHLRIARAENDEPVLGNEIALRLARVLASSARYEESLAILDIPDRGAYAASFDELRGDINVEIGDTGTARQAYRAAISALNADGKDTDGLELKLDRLGPGPTR